MVILIQLDQCWTTNTNLNYNVFDQLSHRLNPGLDLKFTIKYILTLNLPKKKNKSLTVFKLYNNLQHYFCQQSFIKAH